MRYIKQTRISFFLVYSCYQFFCVAAFSVGFSITLSLIDYISGVADGHPGILPNGTRPVC